MRVVLELNQYAKRQLERIRVGGGFPPETPPETVILYALKTAERTLKRDELNALIAGTLKAPETTSNM